MEITYKTVVLHGIETWKLIGKMASTMKTWGKKILRKIYVEKSEQGVCRIRSILEV